MRVWHVGGRGDHSVVDGISMGLWQLAAAQATSAEVTLLCWTPLTETSEAVAAQAGFRVQHVPMSLRSRASILDLVPGPPPDVVVLHGSWSPFLARAGAHLHRRGVPFVLVPHGGHSPALRSQSAWKRTPYLVLVERPLVRRASKVVYLIEEEADDAAELYGSPPSSSSVVPFPVSVAPSPDPWAGASARDVVFLGRFDVFQKGIDDLAELAAALPDVGFHCYGSPPGAADAEAHFRSLQASSPANLEFRPPVHDDDKAEVLRTAALYLQPSRFEGFPLAVTEAMAAGVPVALASRLRMAARLVTEGAAAAIDVDAPTGPAQLRSLLDDEQERMRLASRGREFIAPRLDTAAIARRHLDVYREVLATRSST